MSNRSNSLSQVPAKENYESTYRQRVGCETKYFIQSVGRCPDSLAYWLNRLINRKVDELYVEGDWAYATFVTWVTECCTETANICCHRDSFNTAQWNVLLEEHAHRRRMEVKRAREEAEREARKARRAQEALARNPRMTRAKAKPVKTGKKLVGA